MFPRTNFIRWLLDSQEKSEHEKMLSYAILALGSIFSRQEHTILGGTYAKLVAKTALSTTGESCLSVVQARVLNALYFSIRGDENAAWEMCGSALRAATALRLNTEQGCAPSKGHTGHAFEYGLSREQIEECRRRTFWICLLVDRHIAIPGTTSVSVESADVDLRLPCPNLSYEGSLSSEAPSHGSALADRGSTIAITPMAWLLLVSGVWKQVATFTRRAMFYNGDIYPDAYTTMRRNVVSTLQTWTSRLPNHMQYNDTNLARSIQQGYASTFLAMHVLHHSALAALNRCMRHGIIPSAVHQNIRAANSNAHDLLKIVRAPLLVMRYNEASAAKELLYHMITTPSLSSSIFDAIDIVSAGGFDSDLGVVLNALEGGLECLRYLGQYSTSALDRFRASERRLMQLRNIIARPYRAKSGCWLGRKWGHEHPMAQGLTPTFDCIYGVCESVYFNALETHDCDIPEVSGGNCVVDG